MTHDEWLTGDDPARMLGWLRVMPGLTVGIPSDRKLRLYACACLAASDFAEISRRGIDFADYQDDGEGIPAESLAEVAHDWCRSVWGYDPPQTRKADLLREVVGDPFAPVKLPFDRLGERACPDCPDGEPEEYCDDCGGSGTVDVWGCPWLTPDVLSLAQAAFDERQPDGTLDPLRLAVLSDALEEAGCDGEPLLRHLRGEGWGERVLGQGPILGQGQGWRPLPGPHVRGCWALDLILGKE